MRELELKSQVRTFGRGLGDGQECGGGTSKVFAVVRLQLTGLQSVFVYLVGNAYISWLSAVPLLRTCPLGTAPDSDDFTRYEYLREWATTARDARGVLPCYSKSNGKRDRAVTTVRASGRHAGYPSNPLEHRKYLKAAD